MKTALITALAAIGALTCACSSQGGTAAPQATVTVTASQPASAQPTPPAAATPSVPPPASTTAQPGSSQASSGQVTSGQVNSAPVPAAPAPCLTRYLGAKPGLSQGTTSSTYAVLDFKNLSNHPCTLYGYPGVSLGGGVPVTQIGLSAAENPATPRELVTLPPYGHAYALLQIVHAASYPASTCDPVTAHWLVIYPPNQTVPIYLGYEAQTCAKKIQILTVSAVRSSSSGV